MKLAVLPALLAAAAAGTIAWRSHTDAPFAPPPVPPPETFTASTPDLDLPASTSGSPDHRPGATSVMVTRRALLLAGDPLPFAALSDPELGNALDYRHRQAEAGGEAPPLAILADASTPWRAVAEVLSTATRAGYREVDIAARAPGGAIAWIALPEPWADPFSSVGPAPDLYVTEKGAAIHVHVGLDAVNVARGCDSFGAGLALPAADLERELPACLRRLQQQPRALISEETRISLHVPPTFTWQRVVEVIDALRTPALGTVPLPDVAFAMSDGHPALDEGPPPALLEPSFLSKRRLPPGQAVIEKVGTLDQQPGGVISSMMAGFRRCYRRGLQDDPRMHGKMRITANIGPQGDVTKVTSTQDGISEKVAACVRARVSSAIFAPPLEGRTKIVFPVTFVDHD